MILPGRHGQPPERLQPVLTVQEICRSFRKSRRQVYRYIRSGRIKASARILGQWLFSEEEARRFRAMDIPSFLRPFFWDARVSDLSAAHHRDFILGRLLEWGDRRALKWVFRTYSKESILDFLGERGTGLLSKRSWNFWSIQFGSRPKVRFKKSWRQMGRRWGGVE